VGGISLIDFDLELKKLGPINIKEMELSKYRVHDNIRKSIILYNKAILEIKKSDVGLAIEDLKKGLSYNRSFCEGLKLLGLCYVHEKKYKKAEKVFRKLSEYDIYSDLAREYLKGLVMERTAEEAINAIKEVNSNSPKNKIKYVIGKCLGRPVCVAAAVSIILVTGLITIYWSIPRFHKDLKEVQLINKIENTEEMLTKNPEQNSIAADKYNELDESYKNLQQKLNNTTAELNSFKNKYEGLVILSEAEKLYLDGSYEKAAAALLSIKNLQFDDVTKLKYDKLFSDIKSNAIWTIYKEGNRLYKEGKYQEALPKLKLVTEIDPVLDITPWIFHQIGVCYMETKDNSSALIFFQKVIDNYPKTEYAKYSERLINNIKNN
jgi:tetratricopeptide (TPR) repeat protein